MIKYVKQLLLHKSRDGMYCQQILLGQRSWSLVLVHVITKHKGPSNIWWRIYICKNYDVSWAITMKYTSGDDRGSRQSSDEQFLPYCQQSKYHS